METKAGIMFIGVMAGGLLIVISRNVKFSTDENESEDTLKSSMAPNTDKDGPMEAANKKGWFTIWLDWSSWRDINLVLFAMSAVLFEGIYRVGHAFLPKLAVDMGVKEKHADFLIAVIGIVDVISTILLGWIGNVAGKTARLWMYSVSILCLGFVSCCISFFTSYTGLLLYAITFGICAGGFNGQWIVITLDIVGHDQHEVTIGRIMAMLSIVIISAPTLSGAIYDATGNMHAPFWLYGCLGTLAGLVMLPLLFKREKREEESALLELHTVTKD